uniref:Uncharacterized protein n=1 Tax=Cacopsylla melanoneura TaxID=428564 RepID=A0A8D9BFY2_9HEMI
MFCPERLIYVFMNDFKWNLTTDFLNWIGQYCAQNSLKTQYFYCFINRTVHFTGLLSIFTPTVTSLSTITVTSLSLKSSSTVSLHLIFGVLLLPSMTNMSTCLPM